MHKVSIMSKRIYFNTEKTVTVIKKGYFELDEDFTQVYKSFSEIAFLLALIENIPASVHTLLKSAPLN